MNEMAVNLANKSCFQKIDQIGQKVYVDLCHNGAQHIVPWGGVDWMVFGLLSAVVLMVGAMVVGGIGLFIYDR